jgi:hypothetical protein
MLRHFPRFVLVAFAVVFCGCASRSVRQPYEEVVNLMLYQPNEAPLATLRLLLPGTTSTNWSTGQWKGELSSTYVRPQQPQPLASDLLKAPSWRPLRCRIDTLDPKYIDIELQPDQPTDTIQIWIPLRRHSLRKSNWYRWVNARGSEPEGGAVRVLQR